MRVAIYARVSTADQDCSMQLRELREYVVNHGLTVADEYVDQGVSGTKRDRPALTRLMNDARKRRFDTVVVYKIDRWGRSLTHAVANIEVLTENGIRFIATSQNIDTGENSAMGRFLLHIFAAFSEMERELIVERVRSGMANAKAKGKAIGRPKRVFRRDEAERMRSEGLSWRAIEAKLGVPQATIRASVRKGSLLEPVSSVVSMAS